MKAIKLTGAQEHALNQVAYDNSEGRHRCRRIAFRPTMDRLVKLDLIRQHKPYSYEYHLTDKGRDYLVRVRNAIPCKVGTQPALILLKDLESPRVEGQQVEFRYYPHTWGPWETALITKINEDGYLFLSYS